MRLEMKMQMSAGAAAEREKAAAAIERISLSLPLLHFDPNPIEAPLLFCLINRPQSLDRQFHLRRGPASPPPPPQSKWLLKRKTHPNILHDPLLWVSRFTPIKVRARDQHAGFFGPT